MEDYCQNKEIKFYIIMCGVLAFWSRQVPVKEVCKYIHKPKFINNPQHVLIIFLDMWLYNEQNPTAMEKCQRTRQLNCDNKINTIVGNPCITIN